MGKNEGKLNFERESQKIEIIETEKEKKLMVMGKLYMNWQKEDEEFSKVAISQLYFAGHAKQEDLAKIFKVDKKSVYNYITTYRKKGIKGLIEQPKGPKVSWKVTPEIRCQILYSVLKEGKREYKKIQELVEKRIGEKISTGSIWQVLKENGFIKENIELAEMQMGQGELFTEKKEGELFLDYSERESVEDYSAISDDTDKENSLIFEKEEVNISEDKNISAYSRNDRIFLTHLEQGYYSLYAGGLLYTPMLRQYSFLETIRRVFKEEVSEGVYNLERIVLTLFYFDVFGFRSIENFKTVYPEEYGVLIGRINSPGLRTLRRYLHWVRKMKLSERLMEEYAKIYLQSGLVKWGVLYIDGHFLPYHGLRIITMGWFTVRNKALKGSNNFIANDEEYNPLLFLIRPSSEDLLEKIPEIINKAKKLAGEVGIDPKDLTVIFDREGYSAELFLALSDKKEPSAENGKDAVNFISWAKYADKWVNDFEESKFTEKVTINYEVQKNEVIKYYDTTRMMNKYGIIRAIVIMSGREKKRMALYTNDFKSAPDRIIQLISRRWGQENLIKTLKLRHLIDYHPGYVSEELEEQPMTDNPELLELKKKKANLLSQLHKQELKLAEKILKEKDAQLKLEDLEKREIDLMAEIRGLESQIILLEQKEDELPEEVLFEEAHHGLKLSDLDYEKKRFLDCIKFFAYHMDKRMCELLEKYYKVRNVEKEVWPALAMIVRRGGYLKLDQGKLRVRLKRFKNPVIDYAARHLCEELNQMAPKTMDKFQFPIQYEVE